MENKLTEVSKLLRYYILLSTSKAGSGHPSSSLSAVELMTALTEGGFFKYDLDDPSFSRNDRLIFSKGHASPLLYSLWTAMGAIKASELMTLRDFDSNLEGHPTPRFKYCEAATGSLGQGLSIGFGMALNAKYLSKTPYNTFVLLGDSEMAEGSVWETMQLASYYKLDNLTAIIDVNGLGQTGRTMYGRDTKAYSQRISAFGWETIEVDGHDFKQILEAYSKIGKGEGKPLMIIASTIKGKGVSFIENMPGWHGKALSSSELKKALEEIGEINKKVKINIEKPNNFLKQEIKTIFPEKISSDSDKISTRKAYGNALVNIFDKFPEIVVLDAETSNSTFSETFKKAIPQRYFEMFIAEQNMTGAAAGLSLRGKIPFISTFAAFFTRAYDQIRMSAYSNANIKFVGSHAGVSIGPDGSSQMGLEDIAMFRSIINSIVLYPCDGVSTQALVEKAAAHYGNVYIRTTRADTSNIYSEKETFEIGKSKTLKSSSKDRFTICSAGITVHEALKAYEILKEDGIAIRVIDVYSIKPIDVKTLKKASLQTEAIITVEDHYSQGGLGEAVKSELSNSSVHIMAVRKIPRSGKPEELLDYEEISSNAIVRKIKGLVHQAL